MKALKGKIVLTPVRIPHGDTVRAKLAGLRLTEADICAAVASARAGVAANARAKPRRKA